VSGNGENRKIPGNSFFRWKNRVITGNQESKKNISTTQQKRELAFLRVNNFKYPRILARFAPIFIITKPLKPPEKSNRR